MVQSFDFYELYRKEKAMAGVFDDLGLDPNIDRNNFTKEDAVKVFQKAQEKMQDGAATAEFIDKMLDAGFDLLKIITMFA